MSYDAQASYGEAGQRYGSADYNSVSPGYGGGMDRRPPPTESYGRYDDAPSEARFHDRPRRLVAVKSSCSLPCLARTHGLGIKI
jgi:hypothetical protein